ncbi:MAG: hypothetical protein K8F36_08275, partial [Melioribacteraceae bacterium]|nr:hypothetical protein [Melioribacteraceae bacterium]
KDTSEKVIGRTLGATSHNYVWEEYTIGESGALYDVWGTDENNVYAVGGVRINDTTYGVIHWDGTEWKPELKVGGKYAIYGFDRDDIWITGTSIYHYNGSNWIRVSDQDPILNEYITYTCLWGPSSENLYFGNQGGKIVHWDGRRGRLVSVNEGKFIKDIDGVSNEFIVAVGTSLVPPSLAIYFDGLVWAEFPNVDNLYSINSVAIVNKKHIYWGGEGVFETRGNSFEKTYSSGYYIWDIDYNHETGEVYASGSFDGIYIHNGIEWKSYKNIASSDGSQYVGICRVDDKVFFVGSNDYKAKIIIGEKR